MEGERKVESEPQKPVRRLGFPGGICRICGRQDETYCPDCHIALCLSPECDKAHAVQCEPKERVLIKGTD